MNIYEKMSEATIKIERVKKNLDVGGKYKAVGEGDILDAVKDVEHELKIFSYPVSRKIVFQELVETEKNYNGNISKSNSVMMRIETTYRFVNTEDPKDYIDTISYGDGVDPQDKAPGKAMTYSDKYALMKAYKIETGDDPDKSESKPITRTAGKTEKPANVPFPETDNMATFEQVGEILSFETSKAINNCLQAYSKKGIQFNEKQQGLIIKKRDELIKQGK